MRVLPNACRNHYGLAPGTTGPTAARIVRPALRILCMQFRLDRSRRTGGCHQSSCAERASASVSFPTVFDDNYCRLQGRIALLVELEVTANAVELDSSKCVTHL